jgi:hypothetical protein
VNQKSIVEHRKLIPCNMQLTNLKITSTVCSTCKVTGNCKAMNTTVFIQIQLVNHEGSKQTFKINKNVTVAILYNETSLQHDKLML